MLILVQTITARMEFVFHWMLCERMGCTFELTIDKAKFEQFDEAKFQYGGGPVEGQLYFHSHGLLESTGINLLTMDETPDKVLLTMMKNGVRETDPFADCFFLLSRYEEYLPFKTDVHGRYDPVNSVLFRKNLLQWPLADDIAQNTEGCIRASFPLLPKASRQFSATPTIDIDQAYAYRHKTFIKQLLSLLKSIVTRPGTLTSMYKSFVGNAPDPYDSYDFLRAQVRESTFQFIFFFLVNDASRYDPQVDIHNRHVQTLFRELSELAPTGIHPSYGSSRRPSLIGDEMSRMTQITGLPVTRSRQHYLRFTLPSTYRALIEEGIAEDYTMGYASIPGFRAGTCSSFRWYDLEREEHTELRIFPVTMMEGTFIEYLRLNPTMSWTIIRRLIDVVRTFDGQFIPIWHNHTLSEAAGFGPWKELFLRMLEYLRKPTID